VALAEKKEQRQAIRILLLIASLFFQAGLGFD
jgi:hypothetical protein